MGSQGRRQYWTEEEISKLCEYVGENGAKNWLAVAAYVGTRRTANGCRQRWLEFHQPAVRTGKFTAEEMLTVLLLHSLWYNDSARWSKIAKGLASGRTSYKVKNFYHKTVKNEGTDFPLGTIKKLAKAIEAQGKTVESCLLPTAYNEFVRLSTGTVAAPDCGTMLAYNEFVCLSTGPVAATDGGTTAASSSTATVDYPQGFELMLPQIPEMSWDYKLPNLGRPREIPHTQQNGLLGFDYGDKFNTVDIDGLLNDLEDEKLGLPSPAPP